MSDGGQGAARECTVHPKSQDAHADAPPISVLNVCVLDRYLEPFTQRRVFTVFQRHASSLPSGKFPGTWH